MKTIYAIILKLCNFYACQSAAPKLLHEIESLFMYQNRKFNKISRVFISQ